MFPQRRQEGISLGRKKQFMAWGKFWYKLDCGGPDGEKIPLSCTLGMAFNSAISEKNLELRSVETRGELI